MTKIEKNTIIDAWTKALIEFKVARYRVLLLNCERGCGYDNACNVVDNDAWVSRRLYAWHELNELCEKLKIDIPFCQQAHDLQERFWRYAGGINPDE